MNTKDLEQLDAGGLPARTMPAGKIKKIGRVARPTPINQGDMLLPDKIKMGNLPQDQTRIILPNVDWAEIICPDCGKPFEYIKGQKKPRKCRECKNRIG